MLKKLSYYTSSNKEIILASSSPRRISLLKQWGVLFRVVPSGADENTTLVKPSYVVKELAYRKGSCVAKRYPNFLVLSADTIVVLNGKVVGKPKSKKESEEIIRELNGSTHKVYTGVAIIKNNKKSIFYDIARVKMKKLPENTLKQFFGKHVDKAGSYAVQDADDNFVEKIFGDYYTVVGLPCIKLAKELKKFNINPKV
ncbi:MAG: Maf family protein [Endomicrobium sp.]|uniref:Maf family protein n=1 Tax=Candidatus Endomicrobiellum pyrsonymphae TaxID=1408203 RepID=UPI00357CCE4A|nr:Maf family protein [Endomicrobium sp.]